LNHEIEDMTWGNQKWQGAAPSFRIKLRNSELRISRGCGVHARILDRSIKAEPSA
jgi:hypothetical protein